MVWKLNDISIITVFLHTWLHYMCLQLGMHYIPLIDPGVSGSEKPGTYPPYDEGLQLDIFVKNSSGQPFVGKVSLVWDLSCHNNVSKDSSLLGCDTMCMGR